MRQSRKGQQEVARPGVIDFDILELRECLEHFRANDRLYIGWVAGAVDHATAEYQALVGRQAVVVEQIVAIFDAVILGQQTVRQVIRQRCCGDDLCAARHGFGRQLGHQVA